MTTQTAKEISLMAVRPRTKLTGFNINTPCFRLIEAMLPKCEVMHVVRRRVKIGDRFRVGLRLFEVIAICEGMDDQQHAQVNEVLPWRRYSQHRQYD